MRSSLVRMRSSLMRMRSSLVVRASDCQCTSCNGPGFDLSIRRHSGIWGAADEAVLNIVRTKRKKSPKKYLFKGIQEATSYLKLAIVIFWKFGVSFHKRQAFALIYFSQKERSGHFLCLKGLYSIRVGEKGVHVVFKYMSRSLLVHGNFI